MRVAREVAASHDEAEWNKIHETMMEEYRGHVKEVMTRMTGELVAEHGPEHAQQVLDQVEELCSGL